MIFNIIFWLIVLKRDCILKRDFFVIRFAVTLSNTANIPSSITLESESGASVEVTVVSPVDGWVTGLNKWVGWRHRDVAWRHRDVARRHRDVAWHRHYWRRWSEWLTSNIIRTLKITPVPIYPYPSLSI